MRKIDFLTQKKPKLIKRKLQQADVVKTHGTNKKSKIISEIKNLPL